MLMDKIYNHDLQPYTMLQQYIKSTGGKPAIARLFYYPYDKNTNYAYFIN